MLFFKFRDSICTYRKSWTKSAIKPLACSMHHLHGVSKELAGLRSISTSHLWNKNIGCWLWYMVACDEESLDASVAEALSLHWAMIISQELCFCTIIDFETDYLFLVHHAWSSMNPSNSYISSIAQDFKVLVS